MFMQHIIVEVAWNCDNEDGDFNNDEELVYLNARICNIFEDTAVIKFVNNDKDETTVKLEAIRLQPKYNNRDFIVNTEVEVCLSLENSHWSRVKLREIRGNKVLLGTSNSLTPKGYIRQTNPNPNWSPDNFKYYRRELTDDNLKAFEDNAVITQFCLDTDAFFARIEKETRTLVVIFFNKPPIIPDKVLNAYFPPPNQTNRIQILPPTLMTSSSNSYDQIPFVEELECPVCTIEMQPPIRMCVSGHSICTPCKNRLNNCPICRQEFCNVRNLALESLSIKLKEIPVNHVKYKCGEIDCDWVGDKSCLVDHWTSHQLPIYFDEEIALCENLNAKNFGTMLMIAYNDYFWFQWWRNSNSMQYSVQYAGPPQDAHKYSYRLKITNNNSYVMERFCESVDLDSDDLLASNGRYCCVVTFDAIKRYKTSASYKSMLRIIKN